MSDTSPILFAYEFDNKGGGIPLSGKAIANKVKAQKLAWVHLDANLAASRTWLENNVDYLDHLVIESLLESETRPRVSEFKDGIVVILRGVNLNENADPEDMISIRIYIDEHRIISTQLRQLKAVHDVREQLEDGIGPKNAGEFLAILSRFLFQRMQPTVLELDERTDNAEESVIEGPDTNLRHEINNIRKTSIILRRYIAPQKDAMNYILSLQLPWVDNISRRHIQSNTDRLIRYIEDLDAIRERAQIVKDELANALSDRMNKNMYVLSIVAAIFLPLGFLTGLLGINVGGMPGADNGAAFWVVCALCAGFGCGLLAYFKSKDWL